MWELQVASSAERSLNRLPASAAAAVVEFMVGPLTNEPRRVGKALSRDLEGYFSARRGAYRIVYRLDDDRQIVGIVRIEHRADVYRSR